MVPVDGDVTDASVRTRLVSAARELGGLDLLVNNASELGPSVRSWTFDVQRFGRVFPVNVGAPIALIQLAVPLLAERRGLIVNITSDAAHGAYPGWGPYGASKAALELLTRTLAHELRDQGVSAVLVDPGDMRTRMHQDAFPARRHLRSPAARGDRAVLELAVRSRPGTASRRALRGPSRRTRDGCSRVMADFTLPASLEAAEPPEARGLRRDEVRLLVSDVDQRLDRARALPRSAAMAVARRSARRQHQRHAERRAHGDAARRARHSSFICRRSCREVSGPSKCGSLRAGASLPYFERSGGDDLQPAGRRARHSAGAVSPGRFDRLAVSPLDRGGPISRPGAPVPRAARLPDSIPLRHAVVAERDVPDRVRDRARQRRDAVGRATLHAGAGHAARLARRPHRAASAAHRRGKPGASRTAVRRILPCAARDGRTGQRGQTQGHRVVAVGTTVVRALETVTDETGTTSPGEGWTSLVITPDRPVRSVSGLITGLHDPRATHLTLLEQVTAAAGRSRSGDRPIAPVSGALATWSARTPRRANWDTSGTSSAIRT